MYSYPTVSMPIGTIMNITIQFIISLNGGAGGNVVFYAMWTDGVAVASQLPNTTTFVLGTSQAYYNGQSIPMILFNSARVASGGLQTIELWCRTISTLSGSCINTGIDIFSISPS